MALTMQTSVSDIEHCFYIHTNDLFKQRCRMVDQITQWSNELIEKVKKYTNEQRALVEQAHQKLLENLKIQEKETKSEASVLIQQNDDRELKELLSRCNALKLQLGQCCHRAWPIDTLHFVSMDDNLSEFVVIEHRDETTGNNSIADDQTDPISAMTISPTVDPKSVADRATQTNETPIESIVEKHESHPKKLKMDQDEPMDSCPLCFMIFHPSMSSLQRSRHVNEHY